MDEQPRTSSHEAIHTLQSPVRARSAQPARVPYAGRVAEFVLDGLYRETLGPTVRVSHRDRNRHASHTAIRSYSTQQENRHTSPLDGRSASSKRKRNE